jgi:hypothetical protein
MTTTINASTSSGLVVTPDNSGNVLLQYNGVSTPAFSAYSTSTQTFSAGTWTKCQFNNESFDTANCYDSTTNYRFTPTVAGYYQVNTIFQVTTGQNYAGLGIYKNGSVYKYVQSRQDQGYSIWLSDIVYCNGSTDYLEIYFNPSSLTSSSVGIQTGNVFSGCLLRGA